MPRRFGRPGLLGTMARTAVITGTANATTAAMQNHQMRKMEQAREQAAMESQAQLADMQRQVQQAAPPPPPAPAPAPQPAAPAAGGDDLTAKIQQLADLHTQGVLTDDEFAAAKAKLLGT